MELTVDKRQSFARAKELLAKNDDGLLRYACLEIRFCLEFLAYEKLALYSPRLPKSVRKWQPPQFFKALIQIEPDAARNFRVRISPESKPGVPTGEWRDIGQHSTLDIKWLSKTYNKLGRLLHAPFPDDQRHDVSTVSSTRSYLNLVLKELEPVLASQIDTSLAEVAEFICLRCSEPFVCSIKGLQNTKRAACLDPSCGAEHFAEETGDNAWRLALDICEIPCSECEKPIRLESRVIKLDYQFGCQNCHSTFKVESLNWNLSKVKDA